MFRAGSLKSDYESTLTGRLKPAQRHLGPSYRPHTSTLATLSPAGAMILQCADDLSLTQAAIS
jgi:hypothetical protein